MTERPLEGQKAFVTGASSGLGHRFAVTLARAGAKVALAARRTDRLKELAQEIGKLDGHALSVQLDVTKPETIRNAVEIAETELGPITILVNNSGTVVSKRAIDNDEGDWDHVMDTNLKGAWMVAQEVARRMIRNEKGGSIINIASILGTQVLPGIATYAVSKAGLVQMTRALALEWARHDIRVNALAPGYFVTEINREFLESEAGAAMARKIPMRRFGKPEDLDDVLLLLAGEGSRYITGSVITVDGGHSVVLSQ